MQLSTVTLIPAFFFFNDPATTQIYTLSLHDALPIYRVQQRLADDGLVRDDEDVRLVVRFPLEHVVVDRKSTRLNSSHVSISYAVFCLKKKKKRIKKYKQSKTESSRT